MRISDWSSDVCSSDLRALRACLDRDIAIVEDPDQLGGNAIGEIVGDAVSLVGAVESRQARVPVAANVDFERRGDAECLELIYNPGPARFDRPDRKSTRLNSSH